MSSKAATKKTVKTKTSSEETTRQSSRGRSTTPAASASNGAETPQATSGTTSPRLSRVHEKDELAALNDRLAAYIERVRHLEAENSRLEAKVRASNEATGSEVTTIKTMYQREIAITKRQLDDTSREVAELKIEITVLREDNAKLKDQANKDKSEVKKLQDRIKFLERDVAELNKSLQQETLLRVQAENVATSLKEDLAFKEQVHEQQIKECRTVRHTEVSEVDSMIVEERLQAAIQDMREQYEEEMELNNQELRSKFEEQHRSLCSQLDSQARMAANAIEEVKAMARKIDELEQEKNAAVERARKAEKDAETIKIRSLEENSRQNSEISHLRDEMTHQVEEFKALMDTKVSLDLELATYRKLLEEEEERLNITPSPSPRRTPRKPYRRLKRNFNDVDVETTSSSSGLNVSYSSTFKGSIEITSVDAEGKNVILTNRSDKEVSLGGWQVIQVAGESSTVFKFHRAIKIAPHSTVTVWSSDTNQAHDPPANLVMKAQKWVVSETMSTKLKNPSGEEEASFEYGKHSSTTTFKSRRLEGFRSGRAASPSGRADGEKCSIM